MKITKTGATIFLDKMSEWALYILIFCIPFSKSIIEITIVIAAMCWSLRKIIIKDLALRKTPINYLLGLLFLASLISIINADIKLLVLKSLFSKCLKYIVLYFVIVEVINSKERLKNIFKMGLLSAIIVTIDAYIQYYVVHLDIVHMPGYPTFKYAPLTDPGFRGFPTGPFPFPNDLSSWMFMALMPVLCLVLWDLKKTGMKFILGTFLAPFLFLFYLANTRSAWLSFFISFSLTLFIQNKKIFVVIILLAVIVSLPFLPKEKIKDVVGLTSMADRFYMWRIGWKIFLEHPIIGNGLNTFFTKFKAYREDEFKNLKGSYAHNGYLQLAADTGIIGLFVFLLLICRVFITMFSYIRNEKDKFLRIFGLGLTSGTLAFLINSFFDTNMQSLPLVTLFWFSLAVLMALDNIKSYVQKI